MNNKEITKLKKDIQEDSSEKVVDNLKEEDALYTMSQTEGWKIMMKKYRKTVNELLEPIQHADIAIAGNLELIGAMSIARREKIDALDGFVNQVESVRKTREIMEERKSSEESKEESELEA